MPKTTRNKRYYIIWVTPYLLGNTCKWNKCLDRNPCLHRTTMGTNRKVVHICMHLFHFSSFAFIFFMPNHWCKNCLGHNKGYLWNYLLYLLQIIIGKNFDWSTTNILMVCLATHSLWRYTSSYGIVFLGIFKYQSPPPQCFRPQLTSF